MSDFISVTNLVKSFQEKQVLKDINLSIDKGEVVVIIGPSGSGKSTLLRCISGLDDITDGSITVDGHTHNNKHPITKNTRKKIGFVFQHFNLFSNLNVLDNLTLSPIQNKLYSLTKACEIAKQLLAKVNLSDKESVSVQSLSGGEKQRVAIARALVLNPEIMLFDEPTSALDPETIQDVLNIIKNLTKTGMTLVIVTHEMSFAKEVADRILFLDQGQIMEDSTPDTIFSNPQNQRTKEFLNKIIHI